MISKRDHLREIVLDYAVRPILGKPTIGYNIKTNYELYVETSRQLPSYGVRQFQRLLAQAHAVLYINARSRGVRLTMAAYSHKNRTLYVYRLPETTPEIVYAQKILINEMAFEGAKIVENMDVNNVADPAHPEEAAERVEYGLGTI